MEKKDTGILLNQENLKLQRFYFEQMVRLIGINVIYRAPRDGSKEYNGYGELDSFYHEPKQVGCIFVEHPNQYTMKKLGWVAELNEEVSLIQVPYNLQGLQRGALFIIPSGLDDAKGRLFKVEDMATIAVTPAYITCKLAPVYESTFEDSQFTHETNNFNLLNEED